MTVRRVVAGSEKLLWGPYKTSRCPYLREKNSLLTVVFVIELTSPARARFIVIARRMPEVTS